MTVLSPKNLRFDLTDPILTWAWVFVIFGSNLNENLASYHATSVGAGSPNTRNCGGSSVGKSENLKESSLQLNGKYKFPILFSFRGKEGFLHSIEAEAGANWCRPWEQNEICFCTFLFPLPFRENKYFFEVRCLKRAKLLKKAMLIKCNSPVYI